MEIDRLIQEKRTELRQALAAHQQARNAVEQIREGLSELLMTVGAKCTQSDLEKVRLARAQLQELESAEQQAAIRFNAVSAELTHLHTEKYGSCHVTWIGPSVRP